MHEVSAGVKVEQGLNHSPRPRQQPIWRKGKILQYFAVPPERGGRRRLSQRMKTWFLSLIVPTSAVLLASSATAHAACKEAFFDCTRKGEDGMSFYNLKELRAKRLTDGQITKQCRLVSADPAGCNWRGGGGAVSGGGQTIVLTDAAPVTPTPAAPGAKRDAWGKRSPTPAPVDPAPTPPATIDDGIYAKEIAAAADRYKLPAHLVRAVMMVESGGNPNAVSSAGAVGLMQLLPATAQALGVEDIRDPAQNIMGGARFLRVLANRFAGDMVQVLSGYHAGSMKVQRRGATPYAATDDYVRKILKLYYQLRDAAQRPASARGAGAG